MKHKLLWRHIVRLPIIMSKPRYNYNKRIMFTGSSVVSRVSGCGDGVPLDGGWANGCHSHPHFLVCLSSLCSYLGPLLPPIAVGLQCVGWGWRSIIVIIEFLNDEKVISHTRTQLAKERAEEEGSNTLFGARRGRFKDCIPWPDTSCSDACG